MKKKILFCSGGTGGHVFPSISLINFFKKREYETILVIDKRGAKYLKKDFFLHKIFEVNFPTRAGFINKIFFYLKLILALINSFLILRKEKPNFVFGLGGYVSLPICLAAKLLNIQILLYEPNLVLGRVNKFFVRFCMKLFTNSNNILNLPNKYLTKCVKVGNILREEIIKYELSEKNNLSSKKLTSVTSINNLSSSSNISGIINHEDNDTSSIRIEFSNKMNYSDVESKISFIDNSSKRFLPRSKLAASEKLGLDPFIVCKARVTSGTSKRSPFMSKTLFSILPLSSGKIR